MLELASLSRAFGGLVVIDQLDFKVEQGEIVGILGPNGAGKTTLFNMIAGVLAPSRGRIVFGGRDITRDESVGSLPIGYRPHLSNSKALHSYERFRERARGRVAWRQDAVGARQRRGGSRSAPRRSGPPRTPPGRTAGAPRHETARTGEGAGAETAAAIAGRNRRRPHRGRMRRSHRHDQRCASSAALPSCGSSM